LRRLSSVLLVAALSIALCAQGSFAKEARDSALMDWEKTETFRDRFGGELRITATYYSAAYVEALAQREADKNLWTANELEEFKYRLLKSVEFDKYLPFKIHIDNKGPSMHMAPFGSKVVLWVGNKKYQPVNYDPTFNFRLLGEREGFVYFPRYDEKTGKPILEGAKLIRLAIEETISPILNGPVSFVWDVTKDKLEPFTGKAGLKLELGRLLERLDKLAKERDSLEKRIKEIEEEIRRVTARIEEIQREL